MMNDGWRRMGEVCRAMPCRLLACYEAEVDEVKIDLGGMGRGDYPW